ncbi:MAG: hypothetical protein Q9169_007264 [Polycauliona sp. 2 TL-2023]
MAETIAALALIANIAQFIELGSRVAARLEEVGSTIDEAPHVFRAIRTQLPLLVHTLQHLKDQADQGYFNDETEKALTPVIDGCLEQVTSVEELIEKVVVVAGDSSWQRSRKALASIATEKKVQRIADTLRSYIQTLTFYRTANLKSGPERDSSSQDSGPVFMVPFERDTRYIDRSDVTSRLDSELDTTHRAALAGIGGVGKTQVVVDYCYRYRDRHPLDHVFWVHASTASRIEQAYKQIARKLNLPGWDDLSLNTFEIVSEWLSEHGPWLLILDNADDIDLFYGPPVAAAQYKPMHEYLPRYEGSSTLITTRDTRVAYRLSDRQDPIIVQTMTPQNASILLASRLSSGYHDPRYADDCKQLLEVLSHLPLAITQAAAFITENSITVSEYLEILSVNQAEVEDLLSEELGDHRRDSGSPSSILGTLKPSFDQIVKQKPLAAELLSFMAFLDRTGIPKSLLKRDGIRSVDFISALGTLQSFSLIGTQRGGLSYDMHRLVQVSIRTWLRTSRERWEGEAVRILAERHPSGDYENWEECETLSSHAQTVLTYPQYTEEGMLRCARILHNLATFDEQQSRYVLAEQRFREAITLRTNVLGLCHSDTLSSMSCLGEVLFRKQQYDEAGSVLRTVVAESSKLSGDDAEQTLYNMALGAEVLQGEGKFSEAEMLFRKALQGEGKALRDIHCMRIADNFGAVLRDQKEYDEAEFWIRKGLLGRERLLGDRHPATLRSVNHLALILQMMDRLEEAEAMIQRAVAGSEILLGRDHHLTLISIHNYGKLLRRRGKYDAATEQCRRALSGLTKVLGPLNRATLGCLHSLALIDERQSKFADAEKILQQVVEGNTKTLGPGHEHTLNSLKDLERVSALREGKTPSFLDSPENTPY